MRTFYTPRVSHAQDGSKRRAFPIALCQFRDRDLFIPEMALTCKQVHPDRLQFVRWRHPLNMKNIVLKLELFERSPKVPWRIRLQTMNESNTIYKGKPAINSSARTRRYWRDSSLAVMKEALQ